ncbi:MAG: peptidoglycan-binding domain-containing protein [Candidatus Omnitrophota bacterium]
MKKIAFLMVFALMFSISCAKKTEKPQAEMESEMVMPEAGSALEVQPSTLQQPTQAAPAKDALTSQMPIQPTTVPEKPSSEDIQKALKNAGLYTGNVDGKIGPKTKKAIEQFQSQNGLTVDGKVGAKTWEKLKNYLTKVEEAPVSDRLQ